VAEQRSGLIADLARPEGGRDLGQRLQLVADTEPVGGGVGRHATGAADPGHRADAAIDEMVARLLELSSLGRKLTLERIDDCPQAFQIYSVVLTSVKLAHRRFQSREGCAPFPHHVLMVQTSVRLVNILNS
jgi:hypothetical protein